ncbi:MAG: aldose 1-epimerase family protein [Pseudarthrobacter sp.]
MTEYRIRSGEYTAVITARAAALRMLQFAGRDLVVPFPEGGPIPDYRGIIAAPWPNRIADGKYAFEGIDHLLSINEVERDCALHGLAFPLDWSLEESTPASVTMASTVGPAPGYPFVLRLVASYRVDGDGLQSAVTATNIGGSTAPYGVCPHPYLVAGPAPLNEWTLEVPADEFLEVTPDRLLPVSVRTVTGHAFDFRTAKAIGATEIDHAFTGLNFGDSGRARLLVRDPGGTGVGMEWDTACEWLQIHTADKQPPAPSRLGLAVEPMTCPPDAFNSGQSLVSLEPGGSHLAAWSIFAL